ncbi:MAG TPA: hypothetical protein VFO18_10450 [Methylomirabilota bacterium]|nr:hypothetical protein [Methylomirabilota bacterium]
MRLWRALLASPKGRIVMAALTAWLAWEIWLTARAPAKIAPALAQSSRERVDVAVRLPFAPERFHVLIFQRFGRVSGTMDNEVEVRGVSRADLRAMARPYWVSHIDPLPTGR